MKRLDIWKKKELLKLIFERIAVEGGQIVELKLYEPFEAMYNEVSRNAKKQPTSELTSQCKSACISPLMDVR
jgi:hypothetical protein